MTFELFSDGEQREELGDWAAEAACRGANLDLFFPHRGEDVEVARAFCDRCPVRMDCLDHALGNREHFGIWGGTSERERRRLRRRRKESAA